MNLSELNAISPVDGRYRNKTEALASYFSEYALIKYRLHIEIEYFIQLCEIPLPQLSTFPIDSYFKLREIVAQFSELEANRIKEIEGITNHDVKAVEYFLKEKFEKLGLSVYKEFIHFGLTSQDINNTATPLSLKEAVKQVYRPSLTSVIYKLEWMAGEWMEIPMLAHTHGQPASPTLLGKEIQVFSERLRKQLAILDALPYPAKFGGATGNLNAHQVAYPNIDWMSFSNQLVNNVLGLNRSRTTTQIEHYDNLAAIFDTLRRINVILIDLSRDLWAYISLNYFRQKIRKGEVGSSTMPHKVNPIDFENAEGNLGVANALFDHFSNKLPVSRLQRDLTDSTVLRNMGVPVAHSLIAQRSILTGLEKLLLNEEIIRADLENNWAVVAEAIQTILRREQYPDPYEDLKELTRINQPIDQQTILRFIENLNLPDAVKRELTSITPWNYTGIRPPKQ